jgi:hypothetical protein
MRSRANLALPSRRSQLAWVGLAFLLFGLNGFIGLALAVAIGVVLAFGQPFRHLILAGAAFLASMPVVVIARGLPSPETVSSSYILHDTLASDIAFLGLGLIVTGVVLDGLQRVRVQASRGNDTAKAEQ